MTIIHDTNLHIHGFSGCELDSVVLSVSTMQLCTISFCTFLHVLCSFTSVGVFDGDDESY